MSGLATAPESLLWYWISERHAIWLRRQAGQPKPWTFDPILRDYKFTCPFRENDRGTVWLRENFLTPHRDDDLGLIAFNICWYRLFNWWGTGKVLGWQTNWQPDVRRAVLEVAQASGHQVFTGAHIVYSPPGRGKIEAIVDVCTHLWGLRYQIAHQADTTKRLERVFDLLKTVHCVGGFMAYEMVTDMRHTRLLEDATDIMTWCNIGPGAKRGLQRLGLPVTLESMHGLLARKAFAPIALQDQARAPEWTCQTCGNDAGFCGCKVPLEMRDIEHSLCEFDKYCRVKFGEGQPRSKYPGAAA